MALKLGAISWPILSEHLLHAGLGILFVWLTARISDGTAAAFGVSNMLMMSFFILFRLVGVGASVVVAQNLGAGDERGAARVARASLGAAVWLGVAVGALVAGSADLLLEWMKLEPALRPQATPYLMTLGVVLAIDSVNTTMSSVVRSYTLTRAIMRLVLLTNGVSILVGVPLLLGWFGLPRLGLLGIGLAYVVARLVGLAALIVLYRSELAIQLRASDWWRISPGPLREMLRIGLPGAAETIFYRGSFTLILSLVAAMGTQALATHTYLLQITHLVLLSSLALGFGTEILVGHLVGGRRLRAADRLVRRALGLAVGIAVAAGLASAFGSRWILNLFTDDPQILDLGAKVAWMILLVEPGRAFNLVVVNALRATGDARYPALVGPVSMYLVAFGLAWLVGVHWSYGLIGVWFAFGADEWLRGLLMYARWRRLGWVRYARRARRRALAEKLAAAPLVPAKAA
jgi:putative MATE family efflux protein